MSFQAYAEYLAGYQVDHAIFQQLSCLSGKKLEPAPG